MSSSTENLVTDDSLEPCHGHGMLLALIPDRKVAGAVGYSGDSKDQNSSSHDDMIKDEKSQEEIPSATEINVNKIDEEINPETSPRATLANECQVCYERCELVCKSCQKAFYCSKVHQVLDWARHKIDCFPAIYIKNDHGETVLITTKDLNQGEIILKEKPFILVPSTTDPGDHICLGCYQEVETSVSCSKCKWDICSAKCEQDSLHAEYECEIFSHNAVLPPIAYDAVQLLDAVAVLRLMLMKERDGDKRRRLEYISTSDASHILLPLDELNMKINAQTCVKFIREDCHLRHMETGLIEKTYRILVLHRIRAQEIPMSYRDYRRVSLLFKNFTIPGTSCIPNARWMITGRKTMKYSGAIAASLDLKKGQQVHCDFMQSINGTYIRQEIMKTILRRTCNCARCKDPTECGSYLIAIKCRDNMRCSGGYILPENPLDNCTIWKCNSCGDQVNYAEVITLVNRIHDELIDVGMDLDEKTFKNLEGVIRKHKGQTVHENHYLMLQAQYDYCQRVIHMSQHSALFTVKSCWGDKVVEYTRQVLNIAEILMPGIHRFKGRLLFHLQRGLLISLMGTQPATMQRKKTNGASRRYREKKFAEALDIKREAIKHLEFEPNDNEEYFMLRILENTEETIARIQS